MDTQTLDALSKFITAFAVVALPLLVIAAIGWLTINFKAKWDEVKRQYPEIAYELEQISKIAVMAAEQAKLSDLIDDKHHYAVDIIQTYLAGIGLTVDIKLIDAAIEAAVLQTFNMDKSKDTQISKKV